MKSFLLIALGFMVADAQPVFEVASIKLTLPNVPHTTGVQIFPGGRLVISVTTLKELVAIAYRVPYWQISGGDPWIGKEEYDFEGKPSEPITNLRHALTRIEDEHLCQMLQAFLVNRFQLKFHRETKMGKVYLLTRKGGVLRLQPTVAASAQEAGGLKSVSGGIGFAQGRWSFYNTSMQQLAAYAADRFLHAPVLDQTGLSGSFDYKQRAVLTDWEINYGDPSGPFLLLIPEIGLKLESSKGPVETFVIDHAEKPSSN